VIERYSLVIGRITQDVENLNRVIARAETGMEKAGQDPASADLFLDAVALNLHDFYSGLERIFQFIAAHIDQHVPSGVNWHRDLLHQMQIEITGLRPAVLSPKSVDVLDEYLRFRHVVRNIYTFQFDAGRLEGLVNKLRPSFHIVAKELQDFSDFLNKLIS
jgi:hypothetical protein